MPESGESHKDAVQERATACDIISHALAERGSDLAGYEIGGIGNFTKQFVAGGPISCGRRSNVRLCSTWNADVFMRIQSQDGGNVTGITPISSGITWTYNLDPQGEYIRYTSANDLITYSLDAYGNVVNRNETLSGTTANVQFEQNGIDSSKSGAQNNENYNAWADVTSGGSIQTRRMFGPGFDNPEVAVGASTNWYVKDHQNTVQALLNGSDAATWIGTMDAFGVSTGVAVVDNYGFTGKYTDLGTGLVVTHRDGQSPYNAIIGKFMAEDPIRLASGQSNWQVYVGNSPTNGTDPSGDEGNPNYTKKEQEYLDSLKMREK